MNNFDRAMIGLDEEFQFVSSNKQYVSCTSESEKVSNHLDLDDHILSDMGTLCFVRMMTSLSRCLNFAI